MFEDRTRSAAMLKTRLSAEGVLSCAVAIFGMRAVKLGSLIVLIVFAPSDSTDKKKNCKQEGQAHLLC